MTIRCVGCATSLGQIIGDSLNQDLFVLGFIWTMVLAINLLDASRNNKGKSMDLLALLQGLVASVSALQAQLADAEAALAEAKKLSYDEGFAAGIASVGTGNDKIYSQAELDAQVAAAREGLQLQITDLQSQLDALKAEVDSKVATAVSEAVAALKAQLKAAYEAQQVAESEGETGFKGLLD